MGNYLQKGRLSDSEDESSSNTKQLKRKWSEYASSSSSNLNAQNSADDTMASSSSRSIPMRSPRKKISIIKKIYSASSSANENSSYLNQEDDEDTNDEDNGNYGENRSYLKKCPFNNSLVIASRKKMKSTSDYIFKTLFINGENSDVVVKALDKEWNLHKIYLCQSPYFDSMFKGSKWKESSQSYIEMSIPDQNITESALRVAFGSFYKEDIELIPLEVVNILACASLFSLDGLINQCSLVMQENLSHHTLVPYYDASNLYGVKSVTDSALKWLCNNLMLNDQIRLNEISLNLFETVLSFNDLLIIQVETDLYSIAKKWLFYQLVDKQILLDEDFKFTQKKCNEYLRSLSTDQEKCLLEMCEYSKYSCIFRQIRLQHILSDLQSLKLLYDDRIIPRSWIEPFYYKNWLNLLFIDQSRLANEEYQMNEAEFENKCLRFGRSLADLNPTTWRWVGFNFGVDLLVTHASRNLSLRRNGANVHSPYKGLLSNKNSIKIYFIIKLIELDKLGNEVWSKRTELTNLDFNRNEEKVVFSIDPKAKYPLILNFLVSIHPFDNDLLLNNENSQQVSTN